MITIDQKFRPVLLEAIEEMMYRISLQLTNLKGGPLTTERKALLKKQQLLEELQHLILTI